MKRDTGGLGGSRAWELGRMTVLVWMYSPAPKLSEPYNWGVLWRLPHAGMIFPSLGGLKSPSLYS